MLNRVKTAMENKEDELLIRLIIELYINYDVSEGYEQLVYDLFDYTITYFEKGKLDKFMYLSETVSTLAKAVASTASMRLYYEITTAASYVLNDHESTRKILIEYLEFCRANNFEKYESNILGNIVTVELDLKNYSEAEKTLESVLIAMDYKPSAEYYLDKARLLLEQNITNGALECLDKAFKQYDLDAHFINMIETYLLYATYFVLVKNPKESLKWYRDAIILIENHELTFEQRSVYKRLASLMSLLGMHVECNLYLNKYITLVEQVVIKDRSLLAAKAKLQIFINKKELENIHLKKKNEDIKLENNLDFLTGIYNRRYMTKFVNRLIKESIIFSVLLFDIDYFKEINDNYGHQTGDFILRELSDLLLRLKGEDHTLARIGGDEFVMIFKGLTKNESIVYANQYKDLLNVYDFMYEDNKINLSISGGIKEVNMTMTLDDILKEADICMYKSKRNGKNQIN